MFVTLDGPNYKKRKVPTPPSDPPPRSRELMPMPPKCAPPSRIKQLKLSTTNFPREAQEEPIVIEESEDTKMRQQAEMPFNTHGFMVFEIKKS